MQYIRNLMGQIPKFLLFGGFWFKTDIRIWSIENLTKDYSTHRVIIQKFCGILLVLLPKFLQEFKLKPLLSEWSVIFE